MVKRYKAFAQGTSRIFWNVLDTRTSTYARFCTNRLDAQALARELNTGHKIHKGVLIPAGFHETKWWTFCNIYGEFRETWRYVTCKVCLKKRFTGV